MKCLRLLSLLAFVPPFTQAQLPITAPIASLSYGIFQGAYDSAYNITYFRKIPFAAPPLGINRFRAPQPVIPIQNGTYNSSEAFDMCPQRTVNGSEDCLYLGLYSRPWQPPLSLRPVLVVFYGGAFIEGGGSFNIPPAGYPTLNASVENDYVLIYPNYRVNAWGFLQGKIIANDPHSDLNVGLLDQQAVLLWVNKHIVAFGGNPKNVTIWGQSAGAGSVVAQVIGNPVQQRGLFNKALASSPFWPKTYRYDSLEAEAIYEQFAALANCSGPNSLSCLKHADVQTLRTAALAISGSHTYNTSSYTWAPVIEPNFLPLPLTTATALGKVNAEFAWGMYNTHEGENFIPPGLFNATAVPFNASLASFNLWVDGFLPNLSPNSRFQLLKRYPESGSSESISSYNNTATRAGLIYRDVVLACPAYWLATSAPKKGYLGEYTILPAKHGSDTIYWNQVNAVQKTQPLIYKGYAGAFASFFQTGDPNAHRLTNASEAAVPDVRSGSEWTIETDGFSERKLDMLPKRCGFWRSVAGEVPI